jgi:MFS family permease
MQGGREEKQGVGFMMTLAAPTFAFSMALSLVTTYLPLILNIYTKSATLIGFAIGGEGIFSSLIPLWVGVVSDRIWTKKYGRRKPFMIFAAPFMAAALILAPFQPGYVPIAISTFVFFAAYHFYTSPYQSLLPDVTFAGNHGRVQGFQTFMRGGGMFMGLVIAGFLFNAWHPSPFILNGLLILVFTYVTVSRIKEPVPDASARISRVPWRIELGRIWESLRLQKKIQAFLVANFLWEATLAGLRPFIMLYFLNSLHASLNVGTSLLALVGVFYMIAGLGSGYLADRYGRGRLMRIGLIIYLGGCVFGAIFAKLWLTLVFLPLFGLGASIVLTLPYAILIGLMPRDRIGQFTGMFSMSRGFANIVAPVIAGAMIDSFGPHWPIGSKYSVIWIFAAAMVALSLVFFRPPKQEDAVSV